MLDRIALPTQPTVGHLDQMAPLDLAIAGFLARYRGSTFRDFRTDLRHFITWCAQHDLKPLQATRPHLELYVRWLEERGWASATVARRFGTVALFFKYADHGRADPARPEPERHPAARPPGRAAQDVPHAARVRRLPRRRPGPRRAGARPRRSPGPVRPPDRGGLQPRHRGPPRRQRLRHAPLHRQGQQARHRPAAHPRHAGRPRRHRRPHDRPDPAQQPAAAASTAPPRPARSTGSRRPRHVTTAISPHSLRRTFCTSGLVSGVPLRDMQIAMRHSDPSTTALYDMAANNADRHASHRVAAYLAGMTG